MLSMALSVAVLTSSGGILLEHAPAGIHLLDAPSIVPGALLAARNRDDGSLTLGEVQSMSTDQLKAEYDHLEDDKPGLGLGIGLLSGGIAALVTMVVTWAIYLSTFLDGFGWVGLICLPVGITLTIIGAIVLSRTSRERRRIERDQDLIDRQIRLREGGGGGELPALPPGPTPPPPPPPPPLGGIPMVAPQVVLASF